jgi:hypothetical protein
VPAVCVLGRRRWESGTRQLRGRLEAARASIATQSFSREQLEALPAPVQRYFRTVLREGQPLVAAVDLKQVGTMNLGETGEQWKPFTAKQRVVTRRPRFRLGRAHLRCAHRVGMCA